MLYEVITGMGGAVALPLLHRPRAGPRPPGDRRAPPRVPRLLAGDLRIDALELSGGTLAWEAAAPGAIEADAAAPFAWPRLDGFPLRLRGTLAALRLADLELRPPEGEPQRIEALVV